MPDFRHSRPGDLQAALELVADGGAPYAGGTELLAAMKMGMLAPEHLVDLKRVDELTLICEIDGVISIGACARHAEVSGHSSVRDLLPMLTHVTSTIGNPRVRWQGTVGGNVCFAEPRSDLIPALIALGADVHLVSLQAERVASVESLVPGPFMFSRAPEEIVTRFVVDARDITYQRYEHIRLLERPAAGVALVGRPRGWRLVVGAACYTPLVVEVSSPDDLDPEAIAAGVDVLEDSSGSEDYKRHLVTALARRLRDDALSLRGTDGGYATTY